MFLFISVPAQVVHTSPPYARQELGKDVGLICSIAGTTPLIVKWFKNGAIISETQNGMLKGGLHLSCSFDKEWFTLALP